MRALHGKRKLQVNLDGNTRENSLKSIEIPCTARVHSCTSTIDRGRRVNMHVQCIPHKLRSALLGDRKSQKVLSFVYFIFRCVLLCHSCHSIADTCGCVSVCVCAHLNKFCSKSVFVFVWMHGKGVEMHWHTVMSREWLPPNNARRTAVRPLVLQTVLHAGELFSSQ